MELGEIMRAIIIAQWAFNVSAIIIWVRLEISLAKLTAAVNTKRLTFRDGVVNGEAE